jgi:FG-GAP-like repeat/FG-GAP repeat
MMRRVRARIGASLRDCRIRAAAFDAGSGSGRRALSRNDRARALAATGACLAAGVLFGAGSLLAGCRPETAAPASIELSRKTTAATATPGFLARLEFPTFGGGRAKPVRVLAGDLDGDGRDELVAATRSPGGIEIWSGISPVIGPAPEPRAFAFGDYPLGPVWVDGSSQKGARSLAAIASRETFELAVVDLAAALRSEPGNALPVTSRTKLPARPRAIASGVEIRGGRADLGVVTVEDEVLVYAGSDLGSEPRKIALPHEHAVALLIASDGKRIAVGFQGSRRIAVLGEDGSIGSAATLSGIPRELLEADLDGDGDTELAVAAGDESLFVFGLGRPGGPANWLDGPPLETKAGTVPIALAVSRTSAGERLAVLALHAQEVRLLAFARGAAAPLDRRAAGQRPLDLAIGDFDGDGVPDLAIANGDSRRVGVLFGAGDARRNGTCFASETRVSCDRSPSSIAAGDVDGDGRADVAVLAAADETLAVLSNRDGELTRSSSSVPAPSSSAIACADLGGEGSAAIACLQRGAAGCSITVARNLGRAGVPTLTSFALPGASEASALVLDRLSRSGPRFALVALPETNRVAVSTIHADEGGGDPRFGELRTFAAGTGPRALAVIRGADDADRIAVADGGPGDPRGVTLLDATADAAGEVELSHPLELEMSQFPIAIAAGDLDGDGRQDLAVLATERFGETQGYVVPWLAGPKGTWRALQPLPTGARPHRIATCDLDGDGRADILVTAQGSHHVEVWLARGSPLRFLRAPDLGAGTGPLDLIAVDLDGDGKDEIVVANGFSDDVSVVKVR